MDTDTVQPGAGSAATGSDNASATPAAAAPAATIPAATKPAPTPRDAIGAAVSRAMKGEQASTPAPAEGKPVAPAKAQDADEDEDTDGEEGAGEGGDDAAAEAAATAAEEAAAQAAAEGQDPDFVPPKNLSKEGAERFGKLVERVKAKDAEFQTLHGKFTGIEQTLRGTGATPEQWGQVLTAMRYANSGDPSQARAALQILDNYRAEVARVAGVPIEGVDVLSDFPDLRAKVQGGELDEASAAELAAARRYQRNAQSRNQAEDQRRTDAAQLEQRSNAARDRLSQIGNELQGKDIDFPRKIEVLKARGFFDNIVKSSAPEHWEAIFRAAYDAIGDAAAATRTPAPRREDQPMRPSGRNNNGSTPQPKSIAEAVRIAVNED